MLGRKNREGATPQRHRIAQRDSNNRRVLFTRYYQGEKPVGDIDDKNTTSSKSRLLTLVIVVASLAVSGFVIYNFYISRSTIKLASNFDSYGRQEQYKQEIAKTLSGLRYKIKPSFSEFELEKRLKQKFPEVTSIESKLPLIGGTADITIHINPAILVLTNGGVDYILDTNGKIVGAKGDIPAAAFNKLPKVIDETGFQPKVGNQAISAEEVTFLNKLITKLNSKNISINTITLPPLPKEVHIRLDSYIVKFFSGGDHQLQVGAYLALKSKIESSEIDAPSQYIDVRVEDKAFIK